MRELPLQCRSLLLPFWIIGCSAHQTPIRRIRSGCCARTAIGHAAAPPTDMMNSRRLIYPLKAVDLVEIG